MAERCQHIIARKGLSMAVDASITESSGVGLLEVSLIGIVSMADKDICRDIYRLFCEHRSGIVVICIDRLMLFDGAAAKLVLMLARRAMVNINILHLVVGTGTVRERALQIGFGNVARFHDSYDGFLSRNLG